jgi:hypothetical protein
VNTGFVDGTGQSVACASLADPLDFTTRRSGHTKLRLFVADHAAGLRASTINPQKKWHQKEF